MEMTMFEQAIVYATEKHHGQHRKMGNTPYILHPMEVASIIATMTEDENTLAAGLLHDTIEDCGAELTEISQIFGKRVAALVQSETEDKLSNRPAEETWQQRKEENLLILTNTKDINVKILWLGDKLSNLRSFYRNYLKMGVDLWNCFHQKDKTKHEWYYKTIASHMQELSDTAAYLEFVDLIHKLFD